MSYKTRSTKGFKPRAVKDKIEGLIRKSIGPCRYISPKPSALSHPTVWIDERQEVTRFDPKSVVIINHVRFIDRPIVVRCDCPLADALLKVSQRRAHHEAMVDSNLVGFHFSHSTIPEILSELWKVDERCYIVDLIETRRDILACHRPVFKNRKPERTGEKTNALR